METAAIEAEIAELSQRIAEKRKALETSHGIVEEKELVAGVVKEKIAELSPLVVSGQSSVVATTSTDDQQQTTNKVKPSYLDSLGPEATERLNSLLQLAVDKGLKKAILELQNEDPFMVDVFHDAIADRYYEELKRHGAL